jgi:hypothetical protein
MKRKVWILDILLIVTLISLFVVPAAFAQGENPFDPSLIWSQFAPLLAASAAIERFLQLVRNLISPDPEQGPLARNSRALTYYTTIGGTVMGLGLVYLSNLRLLATVGVTLNGMIDKVLTGIVVGMGTEVVHELIKVIAESKDVLRATAQKDQPVG